MGQLLFGTTLLASFLGGVVALLAPCCVSVMLPAYFATGFRRRSGIVAGTLVFAAGVGTVIVPIGLGASAISAALSAHHLLVYSSGGIAMTLGGLAMLAGWKPRLPMPSAGPAGRGVAATHGWGCSRVNGANALTAYVDGKRQTGDPASIELTSHRQIALVYGPANAKVNVPSSY